MPVSGHEETGIKPIARKSSDYSAGIPIKKRRLPLIRPPPPSIEEPSSLPAENTSEQSPSHGSAISNASSIPAGSIASSVAASDSVISDLCNNIVSEKEKRNFDGTNGNMIQGSGLLSVKLEEPSSIVQSDCFANADSKQKLVAGRESANITVTSAKTELSLKPTEPLAFSIGKEMYCQQNVVEEYKSKVPTVSANTELSLSLREHPFSDVGSQNGDRSCLNHENIEPVSLNLSLSKGESSNQGRSDAGESNTTGASMLADRSNWDLNTTMDAWEGSACTLAATEETIHGLRQDSGTDMKPSVSTVGLRVADLPSKKRIIEEIGQRSNVAVSSTSFDQQYPSEDSIQLGLTPSSLQLNASESPSSLLAPLDASNNSSTMAVVQDSNSNTGNFKTVKSEPVDESIERDSQAAKINPVGLSDSLAVKHELVERSSLEGPRSSNCYTLKLVDPKSIKPEPVHDGNQEASRKMEGTLNKSDEMMPPALDTTLVTASTVLSLHGDISNQVDNSVHSKTDTLNEEVATEVGGTVNQVSSELVSASVVHGDNETVSQVSSELVAASVGHGDDETDFSGRIFDAIAEDKNVENLDQGGQKFIGERLPELRGTVEASVSDEEKINLSGDMLEDDSYGSDYESDGNHDLAKAMDTEQDGGVEDDYEDGEVREPAENTEVVTPFCENRDVEHGKNGDDENIRTEFLGLSAACDNHPSMSCVEEETKTEVPCETNVDNTKELVDTCSHDNLSKDSEKDAYMQELSEVQMPVNGIDEERPIKDTCKKSVDILEKKDAPEGQEGEETSNQAANAIQGTSAAAVQVADEDIIKSNAEEKDDSGFPKTEDPLNSDDAAKDATIGGSRSRIINLSRTSNLSSSAKTRPVSSRPLLSRGGRERLPDIALEEDKFHPRGRHEVYGDSSYKFSRERHQDQSSRSSRLNFIQGRGRVSSRMDNLHNYNSGQDGAFFCTGRGGRKHLSDDASIFPHLSSRRRSPGGRDGPSARGLPMVRRVPRNISPNRCIGEDGPELAGLRHLRGFAEDHTDQMFARSQPSYEGLDSHFIRGNRNFSSVQRRGLPRVRSKSPFKPRTRSPVPWSAPRRRSPEGFCGPSELPRRRSPIYTMERMRSPDHPCFSREMVVRGHGSPYLSRAANDLRDMDPGRDHGGPRSAIPSRSPSGRVLVRSNRRLDLVDPRERTDNDDYFGGPIHAGRFHELGSDGDGEDRRRFGDRRGPNRPFRPPYDGAEAENFHLSAENGPSSFRFCPEDDSEFHERGNLREREFDRRIKNRPGNAPRRVRNFEEQEGNFGPSGQVWHEDRFDDISRVKRKRF